MLYIYSMKNDRKIDPQSHINKRYGNLTVINSIYLNQAKGLTFHWVCKCDCGKVINVRNSILTKRIGCHTCSILLNNRVKNESLKNHGGIKKHIYMSYLKRAKEKNLEFLLTFDETIKLLVDKCYYCGELPKSSEGGYHSGNSIDGEFKKNTIDRIDSTKGYTLVNTVSCCLMCNTSKLDHPQIDFLNWIKRVNDYQELKRSSTST